MDELNFTFSMPDDESLANYISIKGEKGETGNPTKLSQLENDTGFVTASTDALTNYYTKAQTDSAIDADVEALETELGVPDGFFTDTSETVTGEGTTITLNGTANADFKEIKLFGNTQQDGTPTPDDPVDIHTVTGEQTIIITDGDQQSKSFTISLGDLELCKVGNYQDYIYENDNHWYIHKETGKVTLTGSENYLDRTNTSTTHYKVRTTNSPLSSDIAGTTAILCNHFVANSGANNTSYSGNAICGSTSSGYQKQLWFSIDNTIASSVETFKAWLIENPVTVYYALATAIDIEITDETFVSQLNTLRKTNSYSELTTITINGDLSASVSVKAFKNNWSGTISGINVALDNKADTEQVVRKFNSVAEMQLSNLAIGEVATTLGYYSPNDAGGATYRIISSDGEGDGGSLIALDNGLKAQLVVGETINVKQFGAKGDGTTDDTAKIQNALTFASGKKVAVYNGIYMINGFLSADNVEIIGDSTIKAMSTFSDSQMLTPHNAVKIDGIKFDANNVARSCIGESADSTYLGISNCEFTGAQRYVNESDFALNSAVYVSALESDIVNSNVHDNLSHGLRLKAHSPHATANIDNCKFVNNGSRNVDNKVVALGLAQYNGENGSYYDKVTITNCYASGNANSGISPHSCNNITIDNCVSNNNYEHGICLMDGKNATISNCVCVGNVGYGIRIQGDYGTDSSLYHGYKNCVVTGCTVKGNGIFIDEDIDGVEVTGNQFMYETIANMWTPTQGILIGKSSEPTAFVRNAIVTNNQIIGSYDYPVRSYISIDKASTFDNYVNGDRLKGYYRDRVYFVEDSCSSLKYGDTDNILAHPTDFSQWTMVAGATVSNNVITRGTDNFIAYTRADLSQCPRFVSVLAKFSDYTDGAKFNLGIRFRNSGGTLIGGDYHQDVIANGIQGRIFDLSKIDNIPDYSSIAKVEVDLRLSTGSVKMEYCYCALSDDLPILPNKI